MSTATPVPLCPKCGAPMLRREGRRGPFYGCSAYPVCLAVRNAGGGR